jgi:hypothetical protein
MRNRPNGSSWLSRGLWGGEEAIVAGGIEGAAHDQVAVVDPEGIGARRAGDVDRWEAGPRRIPHEAVDAAGTIYLGGMTNSPSIDFDPAHPGTEVLTGVSMYLLKLKKR